MIEMVNEPDAEISLIEGQTKIIKSRRELTRIVISNPLVADVEMTHRSARFPATEIYGRALGTTSLTIWDQTDRSVSFLVRVSLDTKELERRIRQAFPGADEGPSGRPSDHLDGQSPDSKTIADILQSVTWT